LQVRGSGGEVDGFGDQLGSSDVQFGAGGGA
jgi:hypothetical protein